MDLEAWTVDISYETSPHPKSDGIYACINPSWEYQRAQIRFFLPAMVDLSEGNIESTIVHELCHCMVAPMSPDDVTEGIRKLEELTVTRLARAFLVADQKEIPKVVRKKKLSVD